LMVVSAASTRHGGSAEDIVDTSVFPCRFSPGSLSRKMLPRCKRCYNMDCWV
jgi:hypothetical protein